MYQRAKWDDSNELCAAAEKAEQAATFLEKCNGGIAYTKMIYKDQPRLQMWTSEATWSKTMCHIAILNHMLHPAVPFLDGSPDFSHHVQPVAPWLHGSSGLLEPHVPDLSLADDAAIQFSASGNLECTSSTIQSVQPGLPEPTWISCPTLDFPVQGQNSQNPRAP